MIQTRFCYLLMVLCCCAGLQVRAQDPIFSQYFASPLSVNPALAGNGDANWRLMGLRRNQWISAGVEPLNTTSLSFDGRLFKQRDNDQNYIGGGLLFLQDYGLSGAYKSNSVSLAISSHISLDADDLNGLSAGLGFSYANTLIDFNRLAFPSQISYTGFNRSLPTNEVYLSSIKPYYSAFAGINYTYKTESSSFDIGFAGYRFIKSQRSALKDPNQFDPPRYNLHANYQSFLGERVVFNANLMFAFEKTITSYNGGINLGYIIGDYDAEEHPTIFNTGLFYRHNEAIIPYVGLRYGNVQGGVSYDINTSNTNSYVGPLKTFEFSLIFHSPEKRRSPVPCPWK
ncbi:MAG: type IX secretion system membrane protein PorP/SprF [Chitinophagaceae bacterium]|jgi:type IX secretion system PorP/SprF family membrane protein|nr:type IX secretion system membrane protein PorP/SprF [Chitinophagaceae bacterium]